MLKNTLILPTDDDAQAAKLLRDAINDLDVILMLVFGTGATIDQIVTWADQLCNKTNVGGVMVRRVVWVKAAGAAVGQVLTPIVGGAPPMVAVLGFHDDVKATIATGGAVDPVILEQAFLQGGTL
jgi:hypothetical protein